MILFLTSPLWLLALLCLSCSIAARSISPLEDGLIASPKLAVGWVWSFPWILNPKTRRKPKIGRLRNRFVVQKPLAGVLKYQGFVYLAVIDFLRFVDCAARDGSVTLSLQGTESLVNRCAFQLWNVGRVRACWLACLLGLTSWSRELRQFIAWCLRCNTLKSQVVSVCLPVSLILLRASACYWRFRSRWLRLSRC